MKLILCDLNPNVINSFNKHFSHLKNVEIVNKPFQLVEEYDCIVSPANSFGMMDGGFDLHITRYFGTQLMERVQENIIKHFSGEQPVGTSFIIETGNKQHKYLAHTPTMRIPEKIVGTLNVYYAMKAMLQAVKNHNNDNADKIKSVLCSGLGTLSGGVPADVAVKQMYSAYDHVILNPIEKINWEAALNRNSEIRNLY